MYSASPSLGPSSSVQPLSGLSSASMARSKSGAGSWGAARTWGGKRSRGAQMKPELPWHRCQKSHKTMTTAGGGTHQSNILHRNNKTYHKTSFSSPVGPSTEKMWQTDNPLNRCDGWGREEALPFRVALRTPLTFTFIENHRADHSFLSTASSMTKARGGWIS